MAQVVLGEQELVSPIEARVERLAARRAAGASGTASRSATAASPCGTSGSPRREGEIGFEQALELEERLVVEDDESTSLEAMPPSAQAIGDGVCGKAGIVLLAREALLLRGGDDCAIHDERGGAVVVEGGDPRMRMRGFV